MLDLETDLDELTAVIAAVLGRHYRLTPLDVKCTYPVFRGEADGEPPVFVKVGPKEEWARTKDLLKTIGGCGFFSRLLTDARGGRPTASSGRSSTAITARRGCGLRSETPQAAADPQRH